MPKYKLILFVTGTTPKSEQARASFAALCENHLRGDCQRAVIDVLELPDLAEEYRILATPTLIRTAPGPLKRIIGDLSDASRLLAALDVELPTKTSQEGKRDL